MSDTTTPVVDPAAPLPADLADERLVKEKGLVGLVQASWHRIRGGELGSLPVIVGLIVISLVFYAQDATFLSSRTLVNITLFAAPIGIIAIGVVLVLLLGEIDLSVGSVSGLSAAVMAVLLTRQDQSLVVSILAGLAVGLVIGIVYGLLYTRVGVPSLRHHAGRSARVPRAPAGGARRPGHDQPALELCTAGVRARVRSSRP